MNVPHNLTSILSVLSIVLSVAGLVFSPVSATALTSPSLDGPGATAPVSGHHGVANTTWQAEQLQTMITKLGQQGIELRSSCCFLLFALPWRPLCRRGKSIPGFGPPRLLLNCKEIS